MNCYQAKKERALTNPTGRKACVLKSDKLPKI
jgi:hypothetical protein